MGTRGLQWLNITSSDMTAQIRGPCKENVKRTRYLILPYYIKISIPPSFQSNPGQLIWTSIQKVHKSGSRVSFHFHVYLMKTWSSLGDIQTLHWEYMIFNILSMKSSDSNTNMMHQAGWWSLGKIMLGRLIFFIFPIQLFPLWANCIFTNTFCNLDKYNL